MYTTSNESMSAEFTIDEEHPLALELKSLRAAVSRYQHEASSAAIKLQRHFLDTTNALDRSQALERENTHLLAELTVLRAHPDITPQPVPLQILGLTNALRHVSDKLSVTEGTLTDRAAQLVNASSELTKVKAQLEATQDLLSRARSREEECLARQRHLQDALRAAKEESIMADFTIQEYADLVRRLTRKSPVTLHDPSSSDNRESNTLSLVDNLSESKLALHKILKESNATTDKLEAEIFRLNSEISLLQSNHHAEREASEHDRVQLTELQRELDKLRADDNTAAKMVSRYMKFSQNSNNSLSAALENLKIRHRATTATLTAQIEYLQRCLLNEKRGSEKLRHALDELTEDISREMYGRRREISLRIAHLGREENVAESFRKWHRKASESYQQVAGSEDTQRVLNAFELVVDGSKLLLDTLNGQPVLEDVSPASLARILVAQDTVNALVQELQVETDKRIGLEKQLAYVQEAPPLLPAQARTEQLETSKFTHSTPPQSPPPVVDDQPSEISNADDPTIHGQVLVEPEPSVESSFVTRSRESLTQGPSDAVPTSTAITDDKTDSLVTLLDSSPVPGQSGSRSNTNSMPDGGLSYSGMDDKSESLRDDLLHGLAKVKIRYDHLQRAFRNCHLALKDLNESLKLAPHSDTINLVRIAVTRLDDFNEDTRVELEIRVDDEERTTKAFDTLLHVKRAIESEEEAAELELHVRAFVDGTEMSVSRAMQLFSRKLDDLTHDIASIKSFLHEHSVLDSGSSPRSRSPTPWHSLAAGILGTTSRPVSPAPTFGSVMTSPRLRHGTSFTKTRTSSFEEMHDSLKTLNLRISVPIDTPLTHKNQYAQLRTTSMMSSVGFGSRIGLLNPSATPPQSSRAVSSFLSNENLVEGNDNRDIQDDVE